MVAGEAIVLSGTSASGKTTLAKELQRRAEAPLQYMPLDSFIDMLPCWDEPVFAAMEVGYHHAVAATARAGNHVITDHFRPDLDLDPYLGLRGHAPRRALPVGGAAAPGGATPRGVARVRREPIRTSARRPRVRREVDTALSTPTECADAVLGCQRREAFDRMAAASAAPTPNLATPNLAIPLES